MKDPINVGTSLISTQVKEQVTSINENKIKPKELLILKSLNNYIITQDEWKLSHQEQQVVSHECVVNPA